MHTSMQVFAWQIGPFRSFPPSRVARHLRPSEIIFDIDLIAP